MKLRIIIISLAIFFVAINGGCKKTGDPTGQVTFSGVEGSKSVNTYTVTLEGNTFEYDQGYPSPACGTISTETALFTLPVGLHTYTGTIKTVNVFDGHVDVYPIGPLTVTISDGLCVSVRLDESMLKFASVSTIAISSITATSAVAGGNVSSDNGVAVTTRGVCWTSSNLYPTTSDSKSTDGAGVGQFISSISGLDPGTYYNTRAYATNSVGTVYGENVSFKTLGQAASCINLQATNISETGATLKGTVNANELSTIVTFEYGTTTSYSITTTAAQSPVTGNTITNISSDINGLTSGTTYHYRIKAVNSLGTTFSNDLSFTTTSPGSISDVDGNTYNTVIIGTQTWMKESLKTTKYSNGDLIGTTNPSTLNISGLSTPKYQWAYNGNESNVATYGRLYTWYAANDIRHICPTGWRIPTQDDWTILSNYLTTSGYGYEGSGNDIAKSMAATNGWNISTVPGEPGFNQASNNSSAFTAIPSGWRSDYHGDIFYFIGTSAMFWSSEYNASNAWARVVANSATTLVNFDTYKSDGAAIRCIKGL
jgi:uncharacterized protein (TIGR02145 family)